MSAFVHENEFINDFAGAMFIYEILPEEEVVEKATRLHELEAESVGVRYNEDCEEIEKAHINKKTKMTINQSLNALRSIFYQASELDDDSSEMKELKSIYDELNRKITARAWNLHVKESFKTEEDAEKVFSNWSYYYSRRESCQKTKSDYVADKLAKYDDEKQNVFTW